MSAGPPASNPSIQLQVPVSSRARRAYETPLGTCRTCNRESSQGESRTRTPNRARRSERRVYPVPPLGYILSDSDGDRSET
jgi:hypothetical protein